MTCLAPLTASVTLNGLNMAINFVEGDIFASKAQVLVNPVNCVGIMGRGLAKAFKDRYRDNFNRYQAVCLSGELRLGRLHSTEVEPGRYVVNFPTKNHWKDPSTLDSIDQGLKTLAEFIQQKEIKSIAIPKLGCGLGLLDWSDVRPLIVNRLSHLHDVDIDVFGSFL